jgi:hypothetical protein
MVASHPQAIELVALMRYVITNIRRRHAGVSDSVPTIIRRRRLHRPTVTRYLGICSCRMKPS